MPEPDSEPETPPVRPGAAPPKWWGLYGGGFMLVYLVGLPGVQVLTNQASQFYYHFSYATYLWYLLFVGLLALPIAGLLRVLWLPCGRFEPLQRLLAGLLLMFPVPIYLQLGAYKLGWFYLSSGLHTRYALILWLLLLAPVVASRGVFRGVRKTGTVVAKLLSPLPLVMGLFFLGAPQLPSVRQAEPEALQAEREGSPVYILLFDAMDRDRIFQPENAARFPTLFKLRAQSVWFDDYHAYGHGTVQVLPSLLFQQASDVSRNDQGDYQFGDTPSTELDSLFTQLKGDETLCVMGGFHLNYGHMLEGETDWLREYSYYNWNDNAVGLVRTNAELMLNHIYLPENPEVDAAQWLARVSSFAADSSDHLRIELEEQLFACASAPNHDLVVFFHLPVPHVPFIYNREGRHLKTPDPQHPLDEAYLSNVEYVDALLARFIDALKQSGQWEKATLAVTGDHGFDYDSRPPLIVHLPGQHDGRVIHESFDSTSMVQWLKSQR